ncbi:IS5 family transposase [Polaribacter litorisediminis]|uniref:IS5 family transposase n=1 Tax=Polaribacter litorisediminis TaxID=1908341 RepID=UPI001CBDD6CC|nr:IS5 family transposase [Polaribacter litorisediminis]UAM96811.1 IS5 family transposase [Polaribacter litorisediminis]
MINYISEHQLSIEGFATPFETSLLPENRWVKLAQIVPWDTFASIYMSLMNTKLGRPGIAPRIVLGALIIKHMENLDDRGVIATIQENIYMQYFIGLKGYNPHPVFDPSLFVEIRKRIGIDSFDKLTTELIKSSSASSDNKHIAKKKDEDEHPPNKGKLQMDATVADQYITYPTDSKLLNASRKQLEKIIDKLYALSGKKGTKPRTYRRKMNTAFLDYAKKKRKPNAAHRKMNRKLLECVKRNLKHIHKQLDYYESKGQAFPLSHREQKLFWVIQILYDQQKQMYDLKTKSCKDRIVSIFQPHVRPIVRGKTNAKVEFGSKLGVDLENGFARINTLSWDAYNESSDLISQVENYKTLHGYYPELVQVDKIYATRENRAWLKQRNIRITAPPLGRKSKEQLEESYYEKQKRRKEAAERNHIEGKFGQGKNGYNLNKIRARLKNTSESWIATIFFIMNLIRYQKINVFWLQTSIKILINTILLAFKNIIEPLQIQNRKYDKQYV